MNIVSNILKLASVTTLVTASTVGLSATSAHAAGYSCNPAPDLKLTSSSVTAGGSAQCDLPVGQEVGVTTILYIDGFNAGSTYRRCTADPANFECQGTPVTKGRGGTNCSRVLVDYYDVGQETTVFRGANTGDGCPV